VLSSRALAASIAVELYSLFSYVHRFSFSLAIEVHDNFVKVCVTAIGCWNTLLP
jgi:hypothetical protein